MKYRKEYNPKEIGKNLKYYREKNNFSVEYVRQYLRLGSKQAIYKWENGKGYPQTDTMFALMELYGIGLKEVLRKCSNMYSVNVICLFLRENVTYIEKIVIEDNVKREKLMGRMKRYFKLNRCQK